MTPATERWINEQLSLVGLGPVSRDEEVWGQLWAYALEGASNIDVRGADLTLAQVHRLARYSFVRAVELLFYGEPFTELPKTLRDRVAA